jgi:hypothetical protein
MCHPSGMDDTQKQDYFAQAERHIAIAEDRIARQKRIIDELASSGWTGDRLRRNSASRKANAGSMSLLFSKADRTEGEWTSSRTRATVAASGRLCVDRAFCHSKFFAVLMAASITRSEFMGGKTHAERGCSRPIA